MKILGVIPARGGSKGVKNKNIREINNHPLLAYTIRTSLKSNLITDVVVSTDAKEIQDIALKYGAQSPFLRPDYLSGDTAMAIPTIQHAVLEMEKLKGIKYDYVIMLQPTTPLKLTSDIDSSLKRIINEDAEGIISVVTVDNNHPMKMKKFIGENGISGLLIDYEKPPFENCPRQLLPPVFIVNGAIYATKRDVLINDNTFQGRKCLGYIMPPERSVNIDTEFDLYLAEYIMKKSNITLEGLNQ